MLSYDIAGYFATWPQRLHALFQHIKTYREQNRQYVILSNATHRQIELHKAFYSTCRRHTHHVQTTRSVFVCLGIPRFSEGKKLVARISKSEPLILKSKPLIFCPLETRPAGAGDQWPFGHKTVCYMFRKCGQKSRAAWRGRMWNVKRGIRAAVCSGSARDTRWTGVRPRARLRISRLCPTHVRSRGRRLL